MAHIPSITTVRRPRRRSYQRPTRSQQLRAAAARHRGHTPREERSSLYRWSGTATLYTLLALIYVAAGCAISITSLALFTEQGRAVLGAILVAGVALGLVWKSYQRAGQR